MQLSDLLEQHQENLREVVFALNNEAQHESALQVQRLIVATDAVSDYLAEQCLEATSIEIER